MDPTSLYEKFINLAANQYIMRSMDVGTHSSVEQKIPKLSATQEKDQFAVPNLNITALAQKLKENASELGEYSDSSIAWRVNYERFDVEMR